ncbi:MAG: acyl-CoA reductase [Clostridia bacterium]|nr:acyl-CoA reductase [Clostridia bacterium]
MILANGKINDSSKQNEVLSTIEDEINLTRQTLTLKSDIVIRALNQLAKKVENGEYNQLITSVLPVNAENYLSQALNMLSLENLESKMHYELNGYQPYSEFLTPQTNGKRLNNQVLPLGTLFHIAAGNVDGLPSYSVAEGLLCGNVNILKLPQADNGITIKILHELIELEPQLAPFVYVFDTPSEDVTAMKKMAEMCDGIVLWGSETAELAVRKMAPVGVKLIEWGPKLSFAYISGNFNCDSDLTKLAEHIALTKQLFCSSCQNILLDTNSDDVVKSFCDRFFPILNCAAEKYCSTSIGSRAENTLKKHCEQFENYIYHTKPLPYNSTNCSITISQSPNLELSKLFCNVIVKKVPQKTLLGTLRKSKHVLQTAALICPDSQRELLADLLTRSGVTKVTFSGDMSAAFIAEPHDGEYSLRRYTRIVSIEE